MPQNTLIQQFFADYERNVNLNETPALVSQFADTFMAAGPEGAKAVRAEDFTLALPRRKQLFDQLGCRSTTLASLTETALDEHYTIVETQWRLVFVRDENATQDVTVGSTFIVFAKHGQLKIAFYLAHQDVMAVLREQGIMNS